MTYCLIILAIVSITAILAISYALNVAAQTNRELSSKLMARDLNEYARLKPIIEDKPKTEPKQERRPQRTQPQPSVTDTEIVDAQAALSSIRGEI